MAEPQEETVIVELKEPATSTPSSDISKPVWTPPKGDEKPEDEDESNETPLQGKNEPEEGDEDEEGLSEEERLKYGKRAQKRINRLVGARKAVEADRDRLVAEVAELRRTQTETVVRSQQTQLEEIDSRIQRLATDRDHVLSSVKSAREAQDFDAEIKALDALASINGEKVLLERLQRAGKQLAPPTRPQVQQEAPRPGPTPQVRPSLPSDKLLDWQIRNPWFNGMSSKEQAMTRVALVIDQQLQGEGYNPLEDEDEYFNQLDSRIKTRFPEAVRDTPAKRPASPQTTMGSGRPAPRTTGTPKQITLNKAQQEAAQKLGISNEIYARELYKIQQEQR